MSGKDLLESMSFIDDRFIDEAETQTIRKTTIPWLKWVSAAACLCIVILGVICADHFLTGETAGEDTEIVIQNQPGGGKPEAQPPEAVPGESEQPPELLDGQLHDAAPASPKPGSGPPESWGVPSVILRIGSLTEDGFIGVVDQSVDMEFFEIGTELNVVLEEGASEDFAGAYGSGSLVHIQIISFDQNHNTIVGVILGVIEEPIYD